MELGNKIAELRKAKDMTQEKLATLLCVSNQSVSKWESNQCCPDIQLLPKLADIFGVSMDELFGREAKRADTTEKTDNIENTAAQNKYAWADDNVLRVVVYKGHTLMQAEECTEQLYTVYFEYEGEALNVESYISVECGDVAGNVKAGTYVECGDVSGKAEAGSYMECGDVNGNVDAGSYVECGDVTGGVDAGGYIECGDIGGNANAGNYIECSDVGGNVTAGCNVDCGDVEGDVSAGVSVECGDVGGRVK